MTEDSEPVPHLDVDAPPPQARGNATVRLLPQAPLHVGPVALPNRVVLAPMSGVTDLPFRQVASRNGAGLVVSEMVAGRELVSERPDVVRRSAGGDLEPFVIQLVGCEERWMAEGARIAEASGADIIDINMGCPSREVTGRQSGSALMREPDHALRLIDAVVGAVSVPVTLKMRLGWDDNSINAPLIARRAEAAGIRLVTVHARTRCQFFKGVADWSRAAAVKSALTVPMIINGDILSAADAESALAKSGADGVMIGRGAYGAPWAPGRIAETLETGRDPGPPTLAEQGRTAVAHIESMLFHYGSRLGLKNARKHIGWYLLSSGLHADTVKAWRRRLCTDEDAARVVAGLDRYYDEALGRAA